MHHTKGLRLGPRVKGVEWLLLCGLIKISICDPYSCLPVWVVADTGVSQSSLLQDGLDGLHPGENEQDESAGHVDKEESRGHVPTVGTQDDNTSRHHVTTTPPARRDDPPTTTPSSGQQHNHPPHSPTSEGVTAAVETAALAVESSTPSPQTTSTGGGTDETQEVEGFSKSHDVDDGDTNKATDYSAAEDVSTGPEPDTQTALVTSTTPQPLPCSQAASPVLAISTNPTTSGAESLVTAAETVVSTGGTSLTASTVSCIPTTSTMVTQLPVLSASTLPLTLTTSTASSASPVECSTLPCTSTAGTTPAPDHTQPGPDSSSGLLGPEPSTDVTGTENTQNYLAGSVGSSSHPRTSLASSGVPTAEASDSLDSEGDTNAEQKAPSVDTDTKCSVSSSSVGCGVSSQCCVRDVVSRVQPAKTVRIRPPPGISLAPPPLSSMSTEASLQVTPSKVYVASSVISQTVVQATKVPLAPPPLSTMSTENPESDKSDTDTSLQLPSSSLESTVVTSSNNVVSSVASAVVTPSPAMSTLVTTVSPSQGTEPVVTEAPTSQARSATATETASESALTAEGLTEGVSAPVGDSVVVSEGSQSVTQSIGVPIRNASQTVAPSISLQQLGPGQGSALTSGSTTSASLTPVTSAVSSSGLRDMTTPGNMIPTQQILSRLAPQSIPSMVAQVATPTVMTVVMPQIVAPLSPRQPPLIHLGATVTPSNIGEATKQPASICIRDVTKETEVVSLAAKPVGMDSGLLMKGDPGVVGASGEVANVPVGHLAGLPVTSFKEQHGASLAVVPDANGNQEDHSPEHQAQQRRPSQSKGISILKPLFDRDAEPLDDPELDAVTLDITKLKCKKTTKSDGDIHNNSNATGLELGMIDLVAQKSSKPAITIKQLLDAQWRKKVEPNAVGQQPLPHQAQENALNKNPAAATQQQQQQHPPHATPVSLSQAISSTTKSALTTKSTTAGSHKPQAISVVTEYPRNSSMHLSNFIAKSMHTPPLINSAHPMTAPGFADNLTQSVKKVMNAIPCTDALSPPTHPPRVNRPHSRATISPAAKDKVTDFAANHSEQTATTAIAKDHKATDPAVQLASSQHQSPTKQLGTCVQSAAAHSANSATNIDPVPALNEERPMSVPAHHIGNERDTLVEKPKLSEEESSKSNDVLALSEYTQETLSRPNVSMEVTSNGIQQKTEVPSCGDVKGHIISNPVEKKDNATGEASLPVCTVTEEVSSCSSSSTQPPAQQQQHRCKDSDTNTQGEAADSSTMAMQTAQTDSCSGPTLEAEATETNAVDGDSTIKCQLKTESPEAAQTAKGLQAGKPAKVSQRKSTEQGSTEELRAGRITRRRSRESTESQSSKEVEESPRVTPPRGRKKSVSESSDVINTESSSEGMTLRGGRSTDRSSERSESPTPRTTRSTRSVRKRTSPDTDDGSTPGRPAAEPEQADSPMPVKQTRGSKRRLELEDGVQGSTEKKARLETGAEPHKQEDGVADAAIVKPGESSDDDLTLSELRSKGGVKITPPKSGAKSGAKDEWSGSEERVSPKVRKGPKGDEPKEPAAEDHTYSGGNKRLTKAKTPAAEDPVKKAASTRRTTEKRPKSPVQGSSWCSLLIIFNLYSFFEGPIPVRSRRNLVKPSIIDYDFLISSVMISSVLDLLHVSWQSLTYFI